VATLSPISLKQARNFPYNFIVNILDGGFFGLALGFASFSTVLPLFVSNLTDSAILIGIIPAIHIVGWQLPQLFTAHRVSQQERYKPMVMFFTIHERLPFLGLALIAWFIPSIGPQVALVLTFSMLVWQGIGGGLAAHPWQSMIGKIIPGDRWGAFYGAQSSASTLLSGIGAIIAGLVLNDNIPTVGFTTCFLLAIGAFTISYIAVGLTREEPTIPVGQNTDQNAFWQDVRSILHTDKNFRWFVIARILAQIGTAGFAFYAVYLVRILGMDESTAGNMTGVLLFTMTIMSPILGWLGDRWTHRGVMAVGMLAAAASSILAVFAHTTAWFYLVYGLAGIANIAVWPIAMTMVLQFGKSEEKPAYIGLANTLIAPSALIIMLLSGILVESIDYPAAFLVTSIGALATAIVLGFFLHDNPKPQLVSK
jgi:MFS family permease